MTEPREAGPRVVKARFARTQPGAPVRHEVWLDGRLQSSMVLVEHRPEGQ